MVDLPNATEVQLDGRLPNSSNIASASDGKVRRRHFTLSTRFLNASAAKVRADLTNGLAEEVAFANKNRPKTRGDCVDGQRPCPWVSCRFHLGLDVKEGGALVLNCPNDDDSALPEIDLDAMPETCALDVADMGGVSHEHVAAILGVTKQRVEQIEAPILEELEKSGVFDDYRNDKTVVASTPKLSTG